MAAAPSIDFGGTLISVGMGIAVATTRLDSVGYLLRESSSPGTFLIHSKYKPERNAGQLTVVEGKVVAVIRDWTPPPAGNGPALAEAVVAALHIAAQRGPTACTLEYVPYESPGWQDNSVIVTCGERRITISSVRASGEALVSVTEAVGTVKLK
jgi:hypothetical protein